MSYYNAKTIINGYKLGKEFVGKRFIAIPTKYPVGTTVRYMGQELIYINGNPSTKRIFPDKFNRGSTYILHYYEVNEAEAKQPKLL